MKKYSLHIPEGVKDYIGEEAYMKNKIEKCVKELFVSYSYHLIETPTFEYLDVFTRGDDTCQDPRLYKWINRQGEIVALRSDMTKSIARVVASQKSYEPMPQRYAYKEVVYYRISIGTKLEMERVSKLLQLRLGKGGAYETK